MKSIANRAASLDQLFRQADIISLHTKLTAETRGLINARSIATMKSDVVIVNCARGEVINENDLIAALESKKVAGAALDVFAKEPLPADHPYIAQAAKGNLILTPHLGASTEEAQTQVAIKAVELLINYFTKGEVRHAVNLIPISGAERADMKPYLDIGYRLGLLLSQLPGC